MLPCSEDANLLVGEESETRVEEEEEEAAAASEGPGLLPNPNYRIPSDPLWGSHKPTPLTACAYALSLA